MAEEELTTAEMEELQKVLSNVPQKQEKAGVFSFFLKVFKAKDTSKGAFINEDELHSVRTYQSAALYAEEMGLTNVQKFLRAEGEIILGTSLSKEGFLIRQIVTQKREMTAKTVTEKKKKKWLGKEGGEE